MIRTKSSSDGRVRYCGPRATLTGVTNSRNMLQAVDIPIQNNSCNVRYPQPVVSRRSAIAVLLSTNMG